MQNKNFNIKLLDRSLLVFFKDALRVALKSPAQAYSFFRTLVWLRKAARKRKYWAKNDVTVPPIIIFSITHLCNLHCRGCYDQMFHKESDPELSTERMYSIVKEAKELGVSFFVVAGGEPFMRPELLDITESFPEMIFLVFTNGMLIDEKMLARFKQQKNVVPLISLEGFKEETDARRGEGVYEQVLQIMTKLQKKGVFFGSSLTLTRDNFNILTGELFIQQLVTRGCKFFLFLEYTPIQPGTDDMVLTAEQEEKLMTRIKKYRSLWPALFIAVPGDEAEVGGCLSSGRGFVHINAAGDLEPCPFAPFSDANVLEMPLKAALQSDLLKKIRSHPEELKEAEGGCILWQKKEWVKSLLDNS